ncbi:MAG: cyclic nucleotide-binding domain-containing protein [Pseudomonadales bacterium]|nr:cyclic nucleotide-binding domain-containing protein [Pseudomonadales bacterium]NIX09720.1 cyclic nucleotide-binding domain-containing protein [Pseudomonadales bacterium]
MDPRALRCFEPFAALPAAALTALGEQVKILRLPAGRWLVRPGRGLPGCYYLQRGRVRLLEPDVRVAAGSPRSRWPIYPGADGVLTLTPVTLVRVTEGAVAAAAGDGEAQLPLSRPQWLTDGWECRFLSSGAIRRVSLERCQRLMREMRPVDLVQDERVVRQGEPGDTFFVLASGRAQVRRGHRTLAVLEPGDHFGEDAIISGAHRNACVTMISDGRVMQLSGEVFLDAVVERVLLDEGDGPAQATIDIGGRDVSADVGIPLLLLRERLGLLAAKLRYRLVGGGPRQRALAAFVLLHRGYRVALAESGLDAEFVAQLRVSARPDARVAGSGVPVYPAKTIQRDHSPRSE